MKPPRGRGEPVLYLDYDGVLMHNDVWWHPRRGAYLRAPARYTLFQHAPLLEAMLQPYPQVKVVLSTSWVLRYGCAGAAKRLPPGLRARVIGATYHSKMPMRAFEILTRGEQVTADVLRRSPGSWLALDDASLGWPEWSFPYFLPTDPYEGISLPETQEALRERLALLANLQPPTRFPLSPSHSMTIPHERTRALVYTLRFLRELQDSEATPGVPREIRERAKALERHYPTMAAIDLAHMALPGWYGPVEPFLDAHQGLDGTRPRE